MRKLLLSIILALIVTCIFLILMASCGSPKIHKSRYEDYTGTNYSSKYTRHPIRIGKYKVSLKSYQPLW